MHFISKALFLVSGLPFTLLVSMSHAQTVNVLSGEKRSAYIFDSKNICVESKEDGRCVRGGVEQTVITYQRTPEQEQLETNRRHDRYPIKTMNRIVCGLLFAEPVCTLNENGEVEEIPDLNKALGALDRARKSLFPVAYHGSSAFNKDGQTRIRRYSQSYYFYVDSPKAADANVQYCFQGKATGLKVKEDDAFEGSEKTIAQIVACMDAKAPYVWDLASMPLHAITGVTIVKTWTAPKPPANRVPSAKYDRGLS